jgi:hypothetical protein
MASPVEATRSLVQVCATAPHVSLHRRPTRSVKHTRQGADNGKAQKTPCMLRAYPVSSTYPWPLTARPARVPESRTAPSQ